MPIKLTTDFFKYFVPALHKAYPDKDLIIWIQVTKPVTFKIAKSGIQDNDLELLHSVIGYPGFTQADCYG